MGFHFCNGYFDSNLRRMFELEERLSPGARDAAIAMGSPKDATKAVRRATTERRAVAVAVKALRNIAKDDPKVLERLVRHVRVRIEYELNLKENELA